MGQIPIPRAQYGPPARAGTAKPPWPGYMTRKRRAMAGFGEAVFSLADRLGQKINNQLIQSEYVKGKSLLERKNNEFFESLIEDQNYDGYEKRYKDESTKWQEEILSGIKTPGARNALNNLIIDEAPDIKNMLNGVTRGKAQEDALRKLVESIQGTDEEKGFIPSAGATPEELDLGIVNATAAAQGAVAKGTLNKDQAEEIIIYALMEDWPERASQMIDASSLLPQRKLQLKTATKYASAKLAEALEIQREKDRDEISKLIKSGQSAGNAIESSSLDEKEQWIWSERNRTEAERLATGKAIVTNEQIKGELESMAYDIPTGAITMPELKKRLWDERYTKKTIDDSAYDEIFSLAQREFKSYQAGAMKGRESHALVQLVTLPSELGFAEMLAQLETKFEKEQAQTLRQLQFDNLDQYKKALRDWLKTKPDADADEIYEKGRKLLVHYRKSPDQLRKEARQGISAKEGATPSTVSSKEKPAIYTNEKGRVIINSMVKPKSVEEFLEVYKQIKDGEGRKRYYDKWAEDVYKK